MKKDIKYTWIGSHQDYISFFSPEIKEEYNLIIDSIEPDYVFVDHNIFLSQTLMQKLQYYKTQREKSSILIFLGIECVFPDMNIFDYAISLDDNFTLDDRCIRTPALKLANYTGIFDEVIEKPMQSLSAKTKFCNFIYSSSDAHPMRDNIFH